MRSRSCSSASRPRLGKNRSGQSHRPKIDAIKKELRGVQRVIIATDPGREGSMIAWEVLEHLGYKGRVDRLKLGALDEISIRRAFTAMAQEPASGERDYAAYLEALCRQYEDYHLGLNGTRAISLRLRPPAFREPWRFGGVQTPTLAILADLEQRIRDFVPQDFYKIALATTTESGAEITLWHAPKDKIFDKAVADTIRDAAASWSGPLSVEQKDVRRSPPKLFSKDTLARRCAKRFGWDPQHTAKLAQELYDQGYLSYPANRVRAPAREPDGRCWRGDRERDRGAARSCWSVPGCRQPRSFARAAGVTTSKTLASTMPSCRCAKFRRRAVWGLITSACGSLWPRASWPRTCRTALTHAQPWPPRLRPRLAQALCGQRKRHQGPGLARRLRRRSRRGRGQRTRKSKAGRGAHDRTHAPHPRWRAWHSHRGPC